jgi:hypothetical protein
MQFAEQIGQVDRLQAASFAAQHLLLVQMYGGDVSSVCVTTNMCGNV